MVFLSRGMEERQEGSSGRPSFQASRVRIARPCDVRPRLGGRGAGRGSSQRLQTFEGVVLCPAGLGQDRLLRYATIVALIGYLDLSGHSD